MFEQQLGHEVVGLESKLLWLHLEQQISFMPSTTSCNLQFTLPKNCQITIRQQVLVVDW